MPIAIASVFTSNQIQLVRLPSKACFPDEVRKVIVRIRGHEMIITPLKNTWDHFFLNGPFISDDFMNECGEPKPVQHEGL